MQAPKHVAGVVVRCKRRAVVPEAGADVHTVRDLQKVGRGLPLEGDLIFTKGADADILGRQRP